MRASNRVGKQDMFLCAYSCRYDVQIIFRYIFCNDMPVLEQVAVNETFSFVFLIAKTVFYRNSSPGTHLASCGNCAEVKALAIFIP